MTGAGAPAAKRLFGTDGVRGVAGRYPLDGATVARIGEALVRTLPSEGRLLRVVIGRDTRESGPAIEEALVEGIEAAGARVDRGGVLTTPAIACVTRSLGYDAGIVVSASHNPFHDNGIKIFSRGGFKLPDGLEADIEAMVLGSGRWPGRRPRPPRRPPRREPRPVVLPTSRRRGPGPARGARTCYIDSLKASVPQDASFRGSRSVLDCAHGAASRSPRALFRRLGAEVTVLNDRARRPQHQRRLRRASPERLPRRSPAAAPGSALAFDGDADRCLPGRRGGRVLDGDDVLAILAARRRWAPGRCAAAPWSPP